MSFQAQQIASRLGKIDLSQMPLDTKLEISEWSLQCPHVVLAFVGVYNFGPKFCVFRHTAG